MLLSVWATTLSGWTATPQSSALQTLCTLIALLAPVGHLGAAPHDGAPAREVLEELEAERHRIDLALGRDLVEEGFGGKDVGGPADTAERRGAHAAVAIELLGGDVGQIVGQELDTAHDDAV